MANIKDRNERDFRLVAGGTAPRQNFNKIKVGRQTISNDVTIDTHDAERLQQLIRGGHRHFTQKEVHRMLAEHDIRGLRAISRKYFEMSGIYSRLCRYMAYLYKYDWFITPIMYDQSLLEVDYDSKVDDLTQVVTKKPRLNPAQQKVVKNWYEAARYLENSHLKRTFGDIALKVIVDGCFYGFVIEQRNGAYIQELPPAYCRSRYSLNGRPTVEFNVRFFDDMFHDIEYRVKVLKLFPKDIQKAYMDYKKSNLPKDYESDEVGWYLLDTAKAIKFNLSGCDAPLFAPVIPKLMDLEDAQDIDKKKMLQQILRVVIQKLPIDKNGDLIFDVDEAQQLHTNAVQMLQDAIGVDVLTTFADVTVEDMSDNSNVSSVDQLDKVERTVYNEAGTGQNLFNSDGNLSLQYSISNDEATMTNLVLQFEDFAESLLDRFNKSAKRQYRVQILPTTVYNFKDLSTQYKELTAIGFSKLLPQVALGQPQSTVIMTAYFENNLLDLNSIFTPPASSSTTSGTQTVAQTVDSQDDGGRPELSDDEKSDETVERRENPSNTSGTSSSSTTSTSTTSTGG